MRIEIRGRGDRRMKPLAPIVGLLLLLISITAGVGTAQVPDTAQVDKPALKPVQAKAKPFIPALALDAPVMTRVSQPRVEGPTTDTAKAEPVAAQHAMAMVTLTPLTTAEPEPGPAAPLKIAQAPAST